MPHNVENLLGNAVAMENRHGLAALAQRDRLLAADELVIVQAALEQPDGADDRYFNTRALRPPSTTTPCKKC